MRFFHTLFFIILLMSCSTDIDYRKAVINFKISKHKFDDFKDILVEIGKKENMLLTDSSYKFGKKRSPQTRLSMHLKNSNNLEIYINCYSDWQKCSIEFLCYKICPGWENNFNSFKATVSRKWEITNIYKNNHT